MRYLAIFGPLFIGALLLIGYAVYDPLPSAPARKADGARKDISFEGRQIEYYARGKGPVVMLAASAGREASDFNELTATLVEAGYRTLAVEAPGIGHSEIAVDMLLYDLADNVNAVARSENVDRAVVIGHAFGNRVMRAAATKYPDLVHGVILIAAGGYAQVPEKADEALKNCFNPLRTAAQRADDVAFAFFADGNAIPDYWYRGWHMETAIMQGGASKTMPDDTWQSGGTSPMLVVQAAQDRIAPRKDASDYLKATYPDRVEVKLIEQAGHALLPEQPDAIAEAVLGFLERIQSR